MVLLSGMDEEMENLQELEQLGPPKLARDGKKMGLRALNPGGARPNSGPKPAIKKIEARVRRKIEAEFWVEMCETYSDSFIEAVFDENTPWETRFKVWQEINNRALGKPKETIQQNITGIGSLTELFKHATTSPETPAAK